MVKHLRFTIRNTDTGRVLKRIKCNVSGASYNVKQRARNCIADAVSRLQCEERGTDFSKGIVNVGSCFKRRKR